MAGNRARAGHALRQRDRARRRARRRARAGARRCGRGRGSEEISLDAETCAQLRAQVRALQQEVAVMRKAEEERERINAVLSVMQEEGWQ